MFILALVTLLVSFYVLAVICDEFFVPALDIIADKWKLPSDVAGATLMAIGSSAPELCIAFIAVFRGAAHGEVGAGTIVGSAIFNILVIIGASAIFKTAHLKWQPVIRDLSFYSISIILLLLSFVDGKVVLAEAFAFVAVYVLYLGVVGYWKKWFPEKRIFLQRSADPIEMVDEAYKDIEKKSPTISMTHAVLGYLIPDVTVKQNQYQRALAAFGISIGLIGFLSFFMVESAVILAETLHIPAAIIALTIVAAGTSIPDLLSSIAVAKQGRGDMAISNGIGSNIFDILIGLGLPWFIVLAVGRESVTVSTDNLLASIFLLFATVLAVFTLLVLRRWVLGRKAGWLLIGVYVLYLIYTMYQILQ